MSGHHLRPRQVLAIACVATGSVFAINAPSFADANADPFFLSIKPNAQLLPVLHAKEGMAFPEDGREYDYATKGYFKVAGKTVARLPTITGHADGTREHLRIRVKRSTRSTVRAAARRRGTRRATRGPHACAPRHADDQHAR